MFVSVCQIQGRMQRCAIQSRGLQLSSSSVVYLVGHRTLPLVSLMMLERGEFLPQGCLGVNCVAAPGSQKGPVSNAGGQQEPVVLSLPLFLPQFFLSHTF